MAGGGKETPRQKMIGLMYLVLTAMLALNVSKSILNGYLSVNESLEKTKKAITENNKEQIKSAAAEIRGALNILGCDPFDASFAANSAGSANLTEALDGVIQLALAQRAAARERKDFASSDAIRDGLSALGIAIEDTPQGQRWTIKG